MGVTPSRRRMSSDQRHEEQVAVAVEAAIGARPPVEEADAAGTLIEEVLTSVGTQPERAPRGARGERKPQPRPDSDVVVRLDGLETTQEIQDLSHSVPLVAGRATIVRAYLSRPGSAVTVRGELRVARSPFGPWQSVPSLGTAMLAPSRAGSSLADLRSRRADLRYSLNFRLPDDVVAAPGVLYLRLGPLRRERGRAAVPSVAHVRRFRFTLREGVPVRLRLALVSYAMGGTTHTPSTTDVAYLRSFLGRAYPANQVLMTTTTVAATATAPFNASAINAQLAAIRAVDVATGTDARTHYYGMVSDGGFFMRGLAAGIPATPQPQTVASGPTGSTGFAWDTDGSWGDWYGAHEIGHTLGRFHAEFCGAVGGAPYPFPDGQLSGADAAFVGLDVGDPSLGLPMRVLDPIASHDIMTYCSNEWLSSFAYSGIYDRLVAENALAAGATPEAGLARASRAARSDSQEGSLTMRLFASVNLSIREGSISAVLPTQLVGAGGVDAEAGVDPAGTVRARVLDAQGGVLDERIVPFVRSSCEDPDADVTGTVDADLPDVDGAARVVLVVDDTVVAEYPVGGTAAAPSAPSQRAPQGAERGVDLTDGVLHLTWEAAGAPESQRYVVQVSREEGVWETVAVGLAETALDLPTDQFDTDEITVRVLATTGLGTVEVETDHVRIR